MLHVLQLTDLHLRQHAIQTYGERDSTTCLKQVLSHALQRYPEVELILLTGDLVHDDPLAYQTLVSVFEDVKVPILHLSGNHDEALERQRYLSSFPFLSQSVWRNAYWQVITMKSAVAGQVGGEVSEQEIQFIRQQLHDYPKHYTLIATHHHPVSVGSKWLDKIGIKNGAYVMQEMCTFEQVKVMLFGHIHQQFEKKVKHIQLLGTPSTNRQFKPHSVHFKVDSKPPACRFLSLSKEGHVESDVVWMD